MNKKSGVGRKKNGAEINVRASKKFVETIKQFLNQQEKERADESKYMQHLIGRLDVVKETLDAISETIEKK